MLCLHSVFTKIWKSTNRDVPRVHRQELSYVTLPDKDFCQFMRKSGGDFLVLPWWQYYCDEEHDQEIGKKNVYLPMYNSIVERIQWYRRHGIFKPADTELKETKSKFL
ncbi:unnamed protein product [Pieris brassicae]|uniref:Uncharacterized protein n=1 Tax=Pieris brassicae TaxID=7116 RepID=A0A9P0SXV6_PIEBR|nr:unnamed protein product [Pieris brassicae]